MEIRPIIEPIYQTSNYLIDESNPDRKYTYSRSSHPNRDSLQSEIAKLEHAEYGLCFSTGLAAVDAVMRLFSAGDEVLCYQDLYGGSYRLFTKVHTDKTFKFGTDFPISEKAKAIFIETPTNPTLTEMDIRHISMIAKANNLLLIVDNTFATPYYQKPLDLGADIVIHSVSKYLNGHGDVVMGAICLNDKELYERLFFLQRMCGAVPGPLDCWLVSRGLKTLGIRMEKVTATSKKVAEFLKNHPKVDRVNYPGYSGVISFSLKEDTEQEALRICNTTKMFKFAVSIGGTTSLITHCASTNNAIMEVEYRRKIGVTDSLLRLSIGLEQPEELIEDLDQALRNK